MPQSSWAQRIKQVAGGVVFAASLTFLIAATAYHLQSFEIVGPTRPFNYPWRLVEPSAAGRVSAWLGYAAHIAATWILLACAQRSSKGIYQDNFRWFNWAMLAVHTIFSLLHLVQTHLWYDGLAQDVPEITALGSVALLLIIVLILEEPRRGLFFGRHYTFRKGFWIMVRDYHGYFFSWALIYNLWYHPAEGTYGHLLGFVYKFLLLWQSVLVYQSTHLDKMWRLSLELLVIPHSVMVAYLQGKGTEFMFLFGLLSVFVVTQMHGLSWPSRLIRTSYAAFVLGMLASYYWNDRLGKLHEVMRIPIMDYVGVFVLYAMFLVSDMVMQRTKQLFSESAAKGSVS